jgi:adenylosuccinate lyase
VIRRHGLAAARALKEGAEHNDLLERLAGDPAFGVSLSELRAASDPSEFVGRAPQQVDDFLREVVDPLLARAPDAPRAREALRV